MRRRRLEAVCTAEDTYCGAENTCIKRVVTAVGDPTLQAYVDALAADPKLGQDVTAYLCVLSATVDETLAKTGVADELTVTAEYTKAEPPALGTCAVGQNDCPNG